MKELSEMTDRELDCCVAAEVMDWRNLSLAYVTIKGWGGHDPARSSRGVQPVPAYSSDIAAAFTIVDKLMESNFMVSVNASHESGCWCVVYPPSGSPIDSAYADTPAKAICLASLAAVRAGKGEVER
jgi:hypothetical protein